MPTPPHPLRDRACSRCSFGLPSQKGHLARANLCLPRRTFRSIPGAAQALLVIGKAPGRTEDEQDESFVGPAGKILSDWLTCLLPSIPTDIHLVNTVRCRIPHGDDERIPVQCSRACRIWLYHDLLDLQPTYKRITLLTLGADAATALGLGGLKAHAFRRQGQPLFIDIKFPTWALRKKPRKGKPWWTLSSETRRLGPFPCFSTYHPAAILPGRNPSLIHAVSDHLALLADRLSAPVHSHPLPVPDPELPQSEVPGSPTRRARRRHFPCSPFPSVIALDIETYGILKSRPEQTVFLPQRSTLIDGVPPKKQVVMASIAWPTPSGIKSEVLYMHDRRDREVLELWIAGARRACAPIVFMNTLFDVLYLRSFTPYFRKLLSPGLILEDVAAWNHMLRSGRPEASLEALGRLFGFMPPPEDSDYQSKKFRRYADLHDPKLAHYSRQDAIVTLQLREKFLSDLNKRVGTGTFYVQQWYSELLWLCVGMSESGVRMDPHKLQNLATRLEKDQIRLGEEFSEISEGDTLAGPGSVGGVRRVVNEAAKHLSMEDYSLLPITKKTKLLSTDQEARNLLRARLPLEHAVLHRRLELIDGHRKACKIVSSYVTPMLSPSSPERLTHNGNPGMHIAWSQWFPAPSEYRGNRAAGGTLQSRITCKQLGLQTMPPVVEDCASSRFSPGALMKIDLSQLELVIAALLSQDPVMLDWFVQGRDIHTEMSVLLFGESATDRDRQVGKQANFLRIFRGGPSMLQSTVRMRAGIELPLSQCHEIVRALPKTCPAFWAWQEREIDEACRLGYLEEPVLKQRRWFSPSEHATRESYISEICNFRIQAVAANLTLDVQCAMRRHIHQRNMATLMWLNHYDAIKIDAPLHEVGELEKIFKKCLTRSAYRSKLEDGRLRLVPFKHKTDVRVFK